MCVLLQTDLLPTCRELGISVLAYSPLGRGFLTGTAAKDAPPMGDHPWWTNYEKVGASTAVKDGTSVIHLMMIVIGFHCGGGLVPMRQRTVSVSATSWIYGGRHTHTPNRSPEKRCL